MAPIPFLSFRKSSIEPLPVSMCSVRMGERVLQVGIDDASLLGTLAAKPGLSGQSSSAVVDERTAAKVRAAGEKAGALIDVKVTALQSLPFDDGAFDVVIVHGMSGLLTALDDPARVATLRETHRVLRPGGRVILIEPGPGGGLFGKSGVHTDPAALSSSGFRPTRVLAQREGYTFTEGLKG
jgi:SAM-dependent methyltransferase